MPRLKHPVRCTRCQGPHHDGDHRYCGICRALARAYVRQWLIDRQRRGVCLGCGCCPCDGWCIVCRARRAANARALRARRRERKGVE